MRHQLNSPFAIRNSQSPRKGFTLIEVMVYGLVFSVFLIIVTQVFLAIKSSTANSRAVVSVQENYARVLSDLTRTVRGADSVALPLVGQSGSSLSLNNGVIIYRLTDNTLEKIVSGEVLALTDNRVSVQNPVFERIGAVDQKQSVRITFVIEANYFFPGERKIGEEFQTTVTLR